MSVDPSCVQKFDHAVSHLKAFEVESNAFLESDPYNNRIEFEHHQDGTSTAKIHFLKVKEIPTSIGLHLGDAIRNMRSALDHLAYALAAQ